MCRNASKTQNAKDQVRLAYPKLLLFVFKIVSRGRLTFLLWLNRRMAFCLLIRGGEPLRQLTLQLICLCFSGWPTPAGFAAVGSF